MASCSDTKCLPRLQLSLEISPSILACIQHRRPSQPRSARICRAQAVDALSVDTPLIAALKSRAEADQAAFYVPGHKRGSRALESARQTIGDTAFQHDLTELPGLDYLAYPTGAIRQAQALAATAVGAEQTWFLVNGTSCGIHAAVMATCGPGDCLMLARNCHQSAFAAAVFAGCDTWYVQPECDDHLGVAHGIDSVILEDALWDAIKVARKRVKAVLVVSPTYFGACSDVPALALACHAYGIPLIVDEAHGSHFAFDPAFPQSALSGADSTAAADIVVQSSHKTLSALTQAAMLHVRGLLVNRGRVSQALHLLQSSSPSYLLMASLDGARAFAQQQGVWEEPLRAAQLIVAQLQELPGLQVMSDSIVGTHAVQAVDPLRITVGVQCLGFTGHQVSSILDEQYNVVAELATQQVVVFALGIGTTVQQAEKLVEAFRHLCKHPHQSALSQGAGSLSAAAAAAGSTDGSLPAARDSTQQPAIGVNSLQEMSLREAFFARTARVAYTEAAGRVSAELLCPYPPGVPIAIPGEVLQHETIEQLVRVLQNGGTVAGPSDSTLATFLVVAH